MGRKLTIIVLTTLISTSLFAGFNWGGNCSSGEGNFEQNIARYAKIEVGRIPVGKRNVKINLNSPVDADIQLYDVKTGEAIIDWETGLINESTEVTKVYRGVSYRYSGYNGTNGNLGDEFVEILGDTNRELILYAYGYRAGNASMEYSFEAIPTCNEIGNGEFSQYIKRNDTVTVGDIPKGKTNIFIELKARNNKDVDIVLTDKSTGEEIVAWPNGLINGPTGKVITYHGMRIEYSGYNGIDGNAGHETIAITGKVTRNLTMKAFGYAAGTADITYLWGHGVGEGCSGNGGCAMGLLCKSENTTPDVCHTEDWCLNNETANENCGNIPHIATPGRWTCREFTCVWQNNCPLYMIPLCPEGTHNEMTTDSNGCDKPVCVSDGAGLYEMCGGIGNIQCQEGLNCYISSTHPDASGICIDMSLQQGDECSNDSECDEGLLCSNFNINDEVVGTTTVPFALCEPAWMLHEFSDYNNVVTIHANETQQTSIGASNLANVGMSAIVTIKIDMGDNTHIDGLTFTVIPPSLGYNTGFRVSIIEPSKVTFENGILTITDLPVNTPGDDRVNGPWSLKITNMNQEGKSVRLRGWSLKLSSRWD